MTLRDGRRATPSGQATATFTVTGMTCGHCVASVTEEVSELPGVTDVQVVLETGTLTVASEEPLDPAVVRDAVVEAGYDLVLP